MEFSSGLSVSKVGLRSFQAFLHIDELHQAVTKASDLLSSLRDLGMQATELAMVKDGLDLMFELHHNQKSGDTPYPYHCLEVTEVLIHKLKEVGAGSSVTSLLHDAVEDQCAELLTLFKRKIEGGTAAAIEVLGLRFGEEVAEGVRFLTNPDLSEMTRVLLGEQVNDSLRPYAMELFHKSERARELIHDESGVFGARKLRNKLYLGHLIEIIEGHQTAAKVKIADLLVNVEQTLQYPNQEDSRCRGWKKKYGPVVQYLEELTTRQSEIAGFSSAETNAIKTLFSSFIQRGFIQAEPDLDDFLRSEDIVVRTSAALRAAAEEVRRLYDGRALAVENKPDGSPVTLADKNVHGILTGRLEDIFPAIVVSEEQKVEIDPVIRNGSRALWIIDPVDNTSALCRGEIEKCEINIALVVDEIPVLGAIFHFGKSRFDIGSIYLSGVSLPEGIFAREQKKASSIAARFVSYRASLDHLDEVTRALHTLLLEEHDTIYSLQGLANRQSAVFEGQADIYLEPRIQKVWDVAAGIALIKSIGGECLNLVDGKPVRVNLQDNTVPPFAMVGPSPYLIERVSSVLRKCSG